MIIRIIPLFLAFMLAWSNNSSVHGQPSKKKPNILFIAIDDMNDWAGYLQTHPQVMTPSIDSLASMGIYFTNAHCPAPICGPSRTAILSGMWPSTTGIYTNGVNYRRDMSEHLSLPQHFRHQGYRVYGMGKIFHSGASNIPPDAFDEYGGKGASASPFSSRDLRTALQDPFHKVTIQGKLFRLPLNGMPADRYWGKSNTFDWGPVDLPDSLFDDTRTTDWAIETLKNMPDDPFFLAVGFTRPHQPLYNPKRFHDLYPPGSTILPPVQPGDLNDVPRAGREYALAASTSGLHATVEAYGEWSDAVSSYLAAISYVDHLIGRLTDALSKSAYADNTWVVLWSDHGWHLGEKEHWGKATGWSRSTRVPLIIVPPDHYRLCDKELGSRQQMVNLIDLAPTLADLAGIPKLRTWEGQSLVPILNVPDTAWKNHTITTFGYGNHTITTQRWQYIHYFDGTSELYDLANDPNEFENLARYPLYIDTVKKLQTYLPDEPRWKHLVRYHNFKGVVPVDGGATKLFNLIHQNQSDERTDVAKQYPEVVAKINTWIADTHPPEKYITMTPLPVKKSSYLVDDRHGFLTALDSAEAGDSIIWKNGTYRDVILHIDKPGVAIVAQDPGKVVFTGRIEIKLSADYLMLSGIQFINGSTEEDVLQVTGKHIVLDNLNFSNLKCHYYLNILPAARYALVTHCNFERKPQVPNTSVVQVQVHQSHPGYHRIRYCSFKNHTAPKDAGGDYGIEALRIGYSYQSTFVSRTIVEYCYFTKCNGDGEIISSKARENVYRSNTFENNGDSHFTLRHGKDNVVYGNFFVGGAGLRIKEGQNQMVYNNYFNTGNKFAIRLMNHDADPLDSIVIAHNTFVHSGPIRCGSSGHFPPSSVSIFGNLFHRPSHELIVEPSGKESFIGNCTTVTDHNIPPTGFSVADLVFDTNQAGYDQLIKINSLLPQTESLPIVLLDIPKLDDDPAIKLDIMQQDRSQMSVEVPGCYVPNQDLTMAPYATVTNTGPSYLFSVH